MKIKQSLISQADFAKLVGASRQLISKLIKEGSSRIACVKKGNSVLIDKEKSIKLWNNNKDHTKDIGHTFAKEISEAMDTVAPRFDEKITEGLTTAHLVRLRLLADVQKKALELEALRKDLVPRNVVESIIPSLLISVSTQLKMLPKRNASLIASRIKSKLKVEIKEDEVAKIISETIEKDVIEIVNILKRDIKYE